MRFPHSMYALLTSASLIYELPCTPLLLTLFMPYSSSFCPANLAILQFKRKRSATEEWQGSGSAAAQGVALPDSNTGLQQWQQCAATGGL